MTLCSGSDSGLIASLVPCPRPGVSHSNHLAHHYPRHTRGGSVSRDRRESCPIKYRGPRTIASWEFPGVMVRGPGVTPPEHSYLDSVCPIPLAHNRRPPTPAY
jgi:hypothetical protein